MFTTCTRALAQGGRLVIIGMMSQYTDGWAASKVGCPPDGHPCGHACHRQDHNMAGDVGWHACSILDQAGSSSACTILNLGHQLSCQACKSS